MQGNGQREQTCRRIASARSVLVLTGAGVSAESGVPTFRGPGGLWKGRDPMRLATPEAFRADPLAVWEFYDWRRRSAAGAAPNPGHRALFRLEGAVPEFLLVTQNVDGLHQAAGHRSVIELHGSLWRLRCDREGTRREDRTVPLDPLPPRCRCGAFERPDVVWFGECLPGEALEAAAARAARAEVMIVAGTSSLVHPAASLPLLAREAGAWIVEVNPDPTPLSPLADCVLRGPSGVVLPELVEEALAGRAA